MGLPGLGTGRASTAAPANHPSQDESRPGASARGPCLDGHRDLSSGEGHDGVVEQLVMGLEGYQRIARHALSAEAADQIVVETDETATS